MVFEVPQDRLLQLHEESSKWSTFADFSKSQLQALLGKLSFVYACVRSGSVFISQLLNRLRRLSPTQSRFSISRERCSPTLIGSWPVYPLLTARLWYNCVRATLKKSCSHAMLHYIEVVPLVSMSVFRLPLHVISRVWLRILLLWNCFHSSSLLKFGPLNWPAYSFKFRVMTTRWYRLRIQVAHRILSCSVVYDNSG